MKPIVIWESKAPVPFKTTIEGKTITGFITYGAVKLDHSVDVVKLVEAGEDEISEHTMTDNLVMYLFGAFTMYVLLCIGWMG